MFSTYVKLVCLLTFVACLEAKAPDGMAPGARSEKMKAFLDGLSEEDKAVLKKHQSKLPLIDDMLSHLKGTDPNFKKRTLPEDWKSKTKPGSPSHVVSKKTVSRDSVKNSRPTKLDELTDKIIADIDQARQNGISLSDLLHNVKQRSTGGSKAAVH